MWVIDLAKSVVFQTVISGVLVLVLGQLILKFLIEPYHEFLSTIGQIDNELKDYANIITNPVSLDEFLKNPVRRIKYNNCSERIRKLSCNLESSRKRMVLRNKKFDNRIAVASQRMIFIHNNLAGNDIQRSVDLNIKAIEVIRKNLKIPELV